MSHRILVAPDWATAEAWLLDRIGSLVRSDPAPGARVVVPSGTLARHLEDRLLASGVEGFFGRVITTLSGLLQDAADPSASPDHPVRVPDPLRRWRLADLVRRTIAADGPMGQVRGFPGFVAAADDLLRECAEAGIEPEALADAARRQHSAKLRQLSGLYRAYRDLLADQGWTDAPRETQAAARSLRRCPVVRTWDPLVLYGFDDFTTARLAVVRALVEVHPGVVFVVPFDPERREAFASVEWALDRLEQATGAAPQALPRAPAADSFLARLPRHVFASAPALLPADGSVQELTASGPAQMVEVIARQLRRLRHQDPALRWADCAVVVRNLQAYRPLVQEVFPAFGIPYSLAAGTPWSGLRVLVLLRRLLDLKTNGFARDALLECLRSGYCQVRLDPGSMARLAAVLPDHAPPDELARQLTRLAEAVARQAQRPGEDVDSLQPGAAQAEELRAAAVAAAGFHQVSSLPDTAPLAHYAARIDAIGRTLVTVPDLRSGDGVPPDARLSARDREVLELLPGRLRSFSRLWSQPVPYSELLVLLDLLIDSEVLRDPPVRTDAVVLHDPMAARGLSFRIVFVAGLLEKEFPATARRGPFLKDSERQALAAQAGPECRLLSPSDRAAKERLLFVSALETGRERLFLAYNDTDAAGRPTVVSPFVEEVRALVPDLQRASAYTTADVLPRQGSDLWHAEEAATWALLRLYAEGQLDPVSARFLDARLGSSPPPGLEAEVTRWHDPEFTAHDGALHQHSPLADRLRRTWAERPLSPTRLDSYGRCPWQFFAGHILGLAAPLEVDIAIDPLDRGSLMHRILERFYRERRRTAGGRARPVSEEEVPQAMVTIRRIAQEECRAMQEQGLSGHPGAWVYEQRDLGTRLGWFVDSEVHHFAQHAGFAPLHLELSFGTEKHRGADPASTDQPVVLAVGGTPIRARGIVDRIDASEDGQAWVVDYKSGRSAPAASAVQDGTSFQLFVYLLAARDLLGLRPVGGYYLKVSEPPGARGSLPRSGLLSCGSTVPKGQPPWPDLERLLLEYLSAYASDIAAGHFPLLPVSADAAAEPCRHCDFRQICRVSEQRLRLGKQQSASRFARSRMRETRDA